MGGGWGGTSRAVGTEAPHFARLLLAYAMGDRLLFFILFAAAVWSVTGQGKAGNEGPAAAGTLHPLTLEIGRAKQRPSGDRTEAHGAQSPSCWDACE